jgi:hypothetical protein
MKDSGLNSDILKIQALEKEYNAVLNQYEEAYKNCNDELKQNLDQKQRSFKSFPNRAYWGTAGLKEGVVGSETDCENMCASNSKCTGATFNTGNKYCWTRTGAGSLSPTTKPNVAILPTVKSCVVTLNALNTRLIKINTELTTLIKTTNSKLAKDEAHVNNSRSQLHGYYAQLLKERLQMAKILEDQKTIDEEQSSQFMYVDTQNTELRLWSLAACIFSLIIINKMLGKETSVVKLFWITIMIALLIVSFVISNVTGFTVWLIIILLIVLMKMDIIPSPKEE